MSVLRNPRHERFCQYLAQGKTATEAYQLAGFKPNGSNACNMARKEHIRERLTEINKNLGVATKITAETLIARAEKICAGAEEARQFSAAIGAVREMGVLTGHRIERSEVGQPGEFDHLSDEELMADIEQRFLRLRAEISETEH